MKFNRRRVPAETTGHDLAQQHSAIVQYQSAERADMYARHSADLKALHSDVLDRRTVLTQRHDEIVAEEAVLLDLQECI